tara:strand:+ start:10691 stop:11038 length:348 start_codon:yes stop_codon:yes gene_type:complete
MKDTFFAASALCILGSTATAACHDYKTDKASKAPEVIVCYDKKCDLTRLEVQCSGGGNNFTDYAVGWRFGYTYNVHSGDDSVEEYILWKGVVIPPEERDKIRVFDLNDGIAVEVK